MLGERLLMSLFDLNTSKNHNDRFVKVVKSGVFSGFYPRVSSADNKRIDLTLGNDALSVLVTPEGSVLINDSVYYSIARIDFITTTLDRWDLLVCEVFTYGSTAP